MWPAMLLASTMLSGAGAAFAQEPANQSTTLEEIIVTAQKREENLQKVPASVIALGTEKLQQLHVANFADYTKFLPSVTYTVGGAGGGNGGPGFANVYMRGVVSGNDGNHSGSLPSVGTYLDEQPLTTIGGALDVHVYDIARVEQLAGPQGTLYGASSQAGTIRIITNQPDTSGFKAAYDVEVNSVAHGGIGHTEEGFVNIPFSDKIAIRLVGWEEHDAGYIDNIPGTRVFPSTGIVADNYAVAKKNYNTVDTYGGRMALKIDLNDSWTVTPSLMAQSEKAKGNFGYDTTMGELQVQHYVPEFNNDKWYQAGLTIQGKISNFDLVYAGGYTDRRIKGESDYSDYSYFYDVLYAYGTFFTDDNGQYINPAQYIKSKDHFTKQNHEFRISSPQDWRLRFVAGLFYQKQTHFIEQRYQINDLATTLEVPGWSDTLWLTEQLRTDQDYAAFGEVSWDVTSKFTLTGGVRAFKATNAITGFFGFGGGFQDLTGYSDGENKCFEGPTVGAEPCSNLDASVSETGYTHKLNATYHFDNDRMVYFTWSTGFRPGGINRRGSLPPYKSDTLTNYELGWKTTWADNSLRFNGAVFWEDWKDVQFSILGPNSFTEIRNAGAARILGVETDVSWRAARGLTFTGAAAYTDATLETDYCHEVDPDTGEPLTHCADPLAPKGTQLPVTPKFKANATARYEWPIGGFDAHVQGSVIYQGASWADLRLVERSILGEQRAFASADFSAGVERANWSLELSLINAFDKREDLFRYGECKPTICGPETYINTNRPRTIALRFGQKF